MSYIALYLSVNIFKAIETARLEKHDKRLKASPGVVIFEAIDNGTLLMAITIPFRANFLRVEVIPILQ